MAQRVRIPHRGQSPSSATQLPILAALHAGSPTLFVLIIHDVAAKVNTFLLIYGKICRKKDGKKCLTFYMGCAKICR